VEGSLALVLYAARLVDEVRTGEGAAASEAHRLLEVLTPVVKSWPSQYCVEANSHAIQIHGGYGYTRDFPVEQYWRDNRLNMIHEGAHAIHGLDLLGRKVRVDQGAGLALFARQVAKTANSSTAYPALADYGRALEAALRRLLAATAAAWSVPDPEIALANATPYLEAFGHVTIAWLWLDLAVVAMQKLDGASETAASHLRGLLQATAYFYGYELPKIDAWLAVAAARTPTCLEMQDEWY